MKFRFFLIASLFLGTTFCQAQADSSQLSASVEKLGLVYKPARRYKDLPEIGPLVTEKREVTCYPSGCMHRAYDKRDDIMIRFNFLAITREAGDKIREVMPDFDENKNYLGNDSCLAQREAGWLPLLTAKQIKKMNADSAFCFLVPAADFEPYAGKYEGRIVVVLHKKDRGDITMEYFYHAAHLRRVQRQIKRVGEMMRYR
jgi:hypothetical protein